jgi:hypothetical protein
MTEAEPESEPKLIRVVGGEADGIIAPAKSKWGEIFVDPTGHGLADRYEVRTLDINGSQVEALVLKTLSQADAERLYVVHLEGDAASRTADNSG